MLPVHLYYLNDAYKVLVWNCDICDILWLLGRSSITGVPHGGFGLLSPRSPARFKIWRMRLVANCSTAFHAESELARRASCFWRMRDVFFSKWMRRQDAPSVWRPVNQEHCAWDSLRAYPGVE